MYINDMFLGLVSEAVLTTFEASKSILLTLVAVLPVPDGEPVPLVVENAPLPVPYCLEDPKEPVISSIAQA